MVRLNWLMGLLVLTLMVSCASRKKVHSNTSNKHHNISNIQIHQQLQTEIKAWLGTPYKFGGTSHQGIDCSGFTKEIYSVIYRKEIPRQSKQQYELSKKIKLDQMLEGDLVFFNPGTKDISHVGIYIGQQQFVHASVSKGVVISRLDNPYYKKYFVAVGRFE